MSSDPKAYQEYLELYGYFGRDLPRLTPEEFSELDAQLVALIEKAPELEREEVERLLGLQALLFRERPKIETLLARRPRGRRRSGER